VPQADRDKLNGHMSSNTESTFSTSIRDGASIEAQTISFQLETIERPTGFFLLRGK
jgi:hypothetical protein